jgi:hypothetical protein
MKHIYNFTVLEHNYFVTVLLYIIEWLSPDIADQVGIMSGLLTCMQKL